MDRATRPEGTRADVQRGWAVYGADEQQVGTVQAAGTGGLVVRTALRAGHDLAIPVSAIQRIEHDRVSLAVSKDAVAAQGWAASPGVATGDTAPASDGAPQIPESIGTPGLTGVAEEGGRAAPAPGTTGAVVNEEGTMRWLPTAECRPAIVRPPLAGAGRREAP